MPERNRPHNSERGRRSSSPSSERVDGRIPDARLGRGPGAGWCRPQAPAFPGRKQASARWLLDDFLTNHGQEPGRRPATAARGGGQLSVLAVEAAVVA